MKKEFKIGDIAYIGRNMKVKFIDDNEVITLKNIKSDTPVKIINSEKISAKHGGYGYFIEIIIDKIAFKSTHSISQFDFYSKKQWETKLMQEELIKKLIENK